MKVWCENSLRWLTVFSAVYDCGSHLETQLCYAKDATQLLPTLCFFLLLNFFWTTLGPPSYKTQSLEPEGEMLASSLRCAYTLYPTECKLTLCFIVINFKCNLLTPTREFPKQHTDEFIHTAWSLTSCYFKYLIFCTSFLTIFSIF